MEEEKGSPDRATVAACATPLAQAPTAYHLQPGAGAATPAAEAFAAWLKGVGERAAGEGLALV